MGKLGKQQKDFEFNIKFEDKPILKGKKKSLFDIEEAINSLKDKFK